MVDGDLFYKCVVVMCFEVQFIFGYFMDDLFVNFEYIKDDEFLEFDIFNEMYILFYVLFFVGIVFIGLFVKCFVRKQRLECLYFMGVLSDLVVFLFNNFVSLVFFFKVFVQLNNLMLEILSKVFDGFFLLLSKFFYDL